MHLSKNGKRTQVVHELTEKEAEEQLKELQVLGTGISRQDNIRDVIEVTIKSAHNTLD